MAQGKDHIWGGIPLEVSQDESMVDEHLDRYLGRQKISMKKQEALQKRWLMAEWGQQKKKEYMDFGVMVCSKSLFYKVLYVLFIILLVIGFVVLIVELIPKHRRAPPAPDDFTLALQKALLFFDAQKSGVLPEEYSISYRRTSGLKDGILPGGQLVDLTGGLYDSGSNIKFGFPAAFTTTLLCWSVIEYNAKYKAAGELDHVKEIIRWSTDYLLMTFNSSNTHVQQIYAQVGEGGISNPPKENDGLCWQRPEDMDYARVVASCSSAPELGAETAAALAAASIVFKADKQYASALIVAAQKVFAFATDPGKRANYTASGATDAALFYPSSGYTDEHIWAATWLFFATGNWTFLDRATDLQLTEAAQSDYANGNSYGIFDWDNKLVGAQVNEILEEMQLFRLASGN